MVMVGVKIQGNVNLIKKNCNKTPGTQIYNTRNRFFIKEKIQIK